MSLRRVLIFVVGGILLAGIIHITVVLLVPSFATRNAWTTMVALGPERTFHALPTTGEGGFTKPDPFMLLAACRFSVASAPVRIQAHLPDDFWSVAVFDRRGLNLYSLNDRAADRSELDLILVTPLEMARLRADPPVSFDTAIVVELPLDEGFALLRVFVSDPSRRPAAEAALASANCSGPL